MKLSTKQLLPKGYYTHQQVPSVSHKKMMMIMISFSQLYCLTRYLCTFVISLGKAIAMLVGQESSISVVFSLFLGLEMEACY